MEVGPLARLLVAYASGHADVKELVGETLGKLDVPVDGAVLHAGPHRGARPGCGAGHDLAEGVLRPVDGAREDQRGLHLQRRELGAEDLARGCRRRGPDRSSARRAGALDQDSRTAPSRTISWWCRPRGTARRAMPSSSARPSRQSLIGTPVANLERAGRDSPHHPFL